MGNIHGSFIPCFDPHRRSHVFALALAVARCGERRRQGTMRALQLEHFTRKIAAVAGCVSQHAGDARQVDITQGCGTSGEPLVGVRDLCLRQDVAEGTVEGRPVVFGGHGSSLLRSPLHCKVMRRVHVWIGRAGVVAFLLTGQYMDRWLGHLAGVADLPRMLYRSAHIYLLLGSLLNLVLGLYHVEPGEGWRRWVGRTGSILIATAPVLFLMAFAREPLRNDFNRPFAGPGIYACAFGAVMLAIARGGLKGTPKEVPYAADDVETR
jgi:hypothetical protein